jgi:hypothetical protein
MVLKALAAACVLSLFGSCHAVTPAFQSDKTAPHIESMGSSAMGRLYVLRGVRSFGAYIDDYVTINGDPVQRVTPGSGFYCDISPGNYVIGLWRHKNESLKVAVMPGQQQYVSIRLHHLGSMASRGGAITSDQAFDIRLLDPGFGAKRVLKYHMTEANCQQEK